MGAARLVPRPDGYADYVDQSSAPPTLSHGQGQHRYPGPRRGMPGGKSAARQRSIRSTITILLVLPLLSLIALWVYAATSTVGGALAKQQSDAVGSDIRAPAQALVLAVDTERADTYLWQSAHGHLPRTAMAAQRPKTDAAITAFIAGTAAAERAETPVAPQVIQSLLESLRKLPGLRAQVDSGKTSALAVLQEFDAITYEIAVYGGAFTNRAGTVALAQESQALVEAGSGVDTITQEATLVGGAQIAGDRMTTAVLREFTKDVDDQRLLLLEGISPVDWAGSTDPFPAVQKSRAFAAMAAMEDQIIATPAGKLLPVSPQAWQAATGTVIKEFTAAETLAGETVTAGYTRQGDIILLRLVLVGGAGLLAVILSSLLLLRFGNRISRELGGLRGAVRTLAEDRLPSVVSRLRAGVDVDVEVEAPPLNLGTRTKEVTETANAFSAVQRTAVEAAVEQAELRKSVSLVFRSLARRNQSLLQRQLKMLDEMERATDDPEALDQLFRLDHLTTRMRRQAEGLIILSGAAPGRSWRQPVPVIEVLRGALGEIEDFARVDLSTDAPDFLQGAGVADVTHLLAELIENAVLYSPPATRVQVRCGRVANGYCIEIEDRGLGIPDATRHELNLRLAMPPEFDLADSDQLGLFVVSRLADRQQVKVSLRPSAYGGTLAVALLPPTLVVSEEQAVFLAAQGPGNSSRAAASPRAGTARASAAVNEAGPGGMAAAGSMPGHVGGMRRASLPSPEGPPVPARPAVPPTRVTSAPARTASPAAGPFNLPRREPMANLAPQLRDGPRPGPGSPLAGRSPEQARALLSSIRQGFRSGMSDSAGPDGPDKPTDGAGTDDEWRDRP